MLHHCNMNHAASKKELASCRQLQTVRHRECGPLSNTARLSRDPRNDGNPAATQRVEMETDILSFVSMSRKLVSLHRDCLDLARVRTHGSMRDAHALDIPALTVR
eukprot:scaffold4868_cov416-Prasinococcus_capsulatus_cf.AAC.16